MDIMPLEIESAVFVLEIVFNYVENGKPITLRSTTNVDLVEAQVKREELSDDYQATLQVFIPRYIAWFKERYAIDLEFSQAYQLQALVGKEWDAWKKKFDATLGIEDDSTLGVGSESTPSDSQTENAGSYPTNSPDSKRNGNSDSVIAEVSSAQHD